MKRILILLIVLCAVCAGTVSAQKVKVAAKLNVAPLAFGTVNAGLDLGFAKRWVFGVEGYYVAFNPFEDSNSNKIIIDNGWGVDAHLRYYTCEMFNGHHFGIYALGAFADQMTIGSRWMSKIFSGDFMPVGSRDVKVMAGGIEYGYHFPLSYRWGLDLYVGGGLIYADYKGANSEQRHNTGINWSVSKVGIALTYIF